MPLRYSGAIRNPIAEFLAQRPVMILDGALATELQRRGADLHDPLWSARVLLEQPQLIRALHLDYFIAGADVATTASYQASFEGFGRRGIHAGEAARLMCDSVALALAARDEFWDHAGRGARRLRPLIAASGADLLACETIPSLREALVLARLLAEFPGATAWISFSCRDHEHTCEGQPIGDCASALDAFAYAASRQWCGSADAGTLALQARGWYAAGARLIGGCCRTTADDIRLLRAGLPTCV